MFQTFLWIAKVQQKSHTQKFFAKIFQKALRKARKLANHTKIDRSFASGCGTVLFFEDRDVVDSLRRRFPTYAENFDRWSDHTSAMHQLAVWTMLEDAGLGASLQHYNPLIDSAVTARWSLPASWRLVAQMPFGTALDIPAPRDTSSTADNLRIFG